MRTMKFALGGSLVAPSSRVNESPAKFPGSFLGHSANRAALSLPGTMIVKLFLSPPASHLSGRLPFGSVRVRVMISLPSGILSSSAVKVKLPVPVSWLITMLPTV